MQGAEPVLMKSIAEFAGKKPFPTRLIDVVDFIPAVKGAEYPKGTVYIFAAATDGRAHKLKEAGKIRDGAIILQPRFETNMEYLFQCVDFYIDKFIARYVGRAINLAVRDLQFFEVQWVYDYNEQCRIARKLAEVEASIEAEEELIRQVEAAKAYFMDKMFVDTFGLMRLHETP